MIEHRWATASAEEIIRDIVEWKRLVREANFAQFKAWSEYFHAKEIADIEKYRNTDSLDTELL